MFQHTCFVELWLNYFKRNLRPEFSLDCLLLTAKLTVFHLSFLSRHHCLFCFLEYIDNVATKRFSFSALGRYQEAVNCYQAVKPLNIFHDVCGLALSLFMAGQLKESYHGNWSVSIFSWYEVFLNRMLVSCIVFFFFLSAYEQAFQLAETDHDKSCVLTAMGMLGYTLNDKEGAKAMLFKR